MNPLLDHHPFGANPIHAQPQRSSVPHLPPIIPRSTDEFFSRPTSKVKDETRIITANEGNGYNDSKSNRLAKLEEICSPPTLQALPVKLEFNKDKKTTPSQLGGPLHSTGPSRSFFPKYSSFNDYNNGMSHINSVHNASNNDKDGDENGKENQTTLKKSKRRRISSYYDPLGPTGMSTVHSGRSYRHPSTVDITTGNHPLKHQMNYARSESGDSTSEIESRDSEDITTARKLNSVSDNQKASSKQADDYRDSTLPTANTEKRLSPSQETPCNILPDITTATQITTAADASKAQSAKLPALLSELGSRFSTPITQTDNDHKYNRVFLLNPEPESTLDSQQVPKANKNDPEAGINHMSEQTSGVNSKNTSASSLISLASASSTKSLRNSRTMGLYQHELSIREKVEALSMMCEVLPGTNSTAPAGRKSFISIESNNSDLIYVFSKLLNSRLQNSKVIFQNGIYAKEPTLTTETDKSHAPISEENDSKNDEDKNTEGTKINDFIKEDLIKLMKLPKEFESYPSFLTDSFALKMWKISILHQVTANLASLSQVSDIIVGGYLLSLADELTHLPVSSPAGNLETESASFMPSSLKRGSIYSQQWNSKANLLRGLPSPDIVIYLNHQSVKDGNGGINLGLRCENQIDLRGGGKLLVLNIANQIKIPDKEDEHSEFNDEIKQILKALT
ncbi:hypothetical protein NADFUDRAFT_70718 [Nadsonia fulvescens var. elongata DSM 6958]|uniref:Uncharacterized protein n=1 Tax=Nadsonia fulvescens var. elongata DSM 6958 TaxID=857566 RepID=A0A1E3PJU8_9ASCO|nr:hypothetical protein NADFUDRAFT_70718 [Nadsonia fulvescens var. elongata DSM 6958]